MKLDRTTRYTPAVTMVAAWINAETGVGPSIASSSQDCSGTWADLPQAPSRRSRPSTVAVAALALGMPSFTARKADEPKVASISMIAIDSPPADRRDQVVVGDHPQKHRRHEQVQAREQAASLGVVRQVADREDVDQA